MSEPTDRQGEPPGRGLARSGPGRPRKALPRSMPQAQQDFADVMRDQVFNPLRAAGWPLEKISRRLSEDGAAGFSTPTLSRIASGQRIPQPQVLEAILDLVGEVAGQPVPRAARQELDALRLRALAVASPGRYRTEILEHDNRRLRTERDRLYHLHTGSPDAPAPQQDASGDDEAEDAVAEEAGAELLPPPVRTLRADTVVHIADVIAAGITLPARMMTPEPAEPVTILGVLQEIDDVLQHSARALHRALAADTEDQPPDHPTPPAPPAPAAVIAPSYDEPGTLRPAQTGCAPAVVGLLVVAVLVLAYLYLLPLLDKDRTGDTATPTASETVTATTTRDPQPSDTPRPGLTPTPDTGTDGDPGPGPSKTKEDSSQTSTGPTITFTSPSTDQEQGPVLGGWGVNASPRLDAADCSQPIVFTLSAAAQRPGAVQYTWHPDDRLIARGVQDRPGTMTFTTTNEQHDEFTVQLTGTQPGERVQGGMTVEVTSPDANRGTSGDVFDITCA
ncbi:hypothetical protein ACIPSE_46020 [Streptomyces sp. NPDC090106]|uniref:hypothetical protein n=1 Tax=Streptomyces sp. NPDC090106 TaxID=3365946 RepID=UPI00382E988D